MAKWSAYILNGQEQRLHTGLRLRKLTFTGVWSLHVGCVAKAEDRPDEADG